MVERGNLFQDLNQVLSSELAGSTASRNQRRQPNFGHANSCWRGIGLDHSSTVNTWMVLVLPVV
jgi:hypothetical protein